MTQLKAKWRELSDDARSFWSELFSSATKQADIRSQLLAKLKINLRFDKQLTVFRQWVQQQEVLDTEAEAMEDDQRRLNQEFGADWTLDQIREEVLKRSYARAITTGDFASGRKTIVQDLNVKKVALDERKLVMLEKKAEAYDRAQAALESAKNSKGGITKETLKKIEAELKLL